VVEPQFTHGGWSGVDDGEREDESTAGGDGVYDESLELLGGSCMESAGWVARKSDEHQAPLREGRRAATRIRPRPHKTGS
jgi:hypothetical protein